MIEGKKVSNFSGSKVEWVEEESFFFKLSNWQDKLLKYYKNIKDFKGSKSLNDKLKKTCYNYKPDIIMLGDIGSVILAAILLKMAGYGLFRINLGFFQETLGFQIFDYYRTA